jgi:hypothetical protein
MTKYEYKYSSLLICQQLRKHDNGQMLQNVRKTQAQYLANALQKLIYILFVLTSMNNLDFITSYMLNFSTLLDKTRLGFHMLNTNILQTEVSQMAI